jgi:hypothetical protein
MKAIKYFFFVVLLAFSSKLLSQDQTILIFDPNGVSTSFQYTLSQLSEDSLFIADSLDDSIYNYDAAFLFLTNNNPLSEADVNRLINYTSSNKPTYLFSLPAMDSTTTLFANHIGLYEIVWFLTSTYVDSITGIDTVFTKSVLIDTSFMNWAGVPMIVGEMDPILHAWSTPLNFNPTYISTVDTLQVIFDLYNLIDDEGFLRKVLEYFDLIQQPQNVDIQFYPSVDTALVNGGCCTPLIIARNLISTPVRDSISIEPGPNTLFYYIDSTGSQVTIDNYYFIVIDSLNEFDYELWYHPKSFSNFSPIIIPFDSSYYTHENFYDIQLIVNKSGTKIDSFSQPFHADYGLSVDDLDRIPNKFSLSQNYPNPFNPSTTIKFTIPQTPLSFGEGLEVRLIVYDILGNEIVTLVNEEKKPGVYEVEFNIDSHSGEIRNLPAGRQGLVSGIYFYQLRAGDFVETKKMVLLK